MPKLRPLSDAPFCTACRYFKKQGRIHAENAICMHPEATTIHIVSGRPVGSSCYTQRHGACGPYGKNFQARPPSFGRRVARRIDYIVGGFINFVRLKWINRKRT